MKKLFVVLMLLTTLQGWANKLSVTNTQELLNIGLQAKAGDTVVIKSGNYLNCNLIISAKGTAVQPIVFMAQVPGGVHFTGNSYLHITGTYITVSGVVFKDGYAGKNHVWQFSHGKEVANNSRITASSIQSFNNPLRLDENHWLTLSGKNNRVDHCNFSDKTNLGVLVAVLLDDDRSRINNHSIDSNYFGIRKPLGSNAGEMIRVGVSQHCTFYSNTVIKNNFFEYCDGETEIVSIKSCGNKVVGNVFKECQGAVVLRHGNDNTVEGNLFYGNDKEGTGGVRVINEGNWIVNNFMSHCKGQGFRSPLAIMAGVFNSPANRYLPVRDAVIANNTFLNCTPFSISEGKMQSVALTLKMCSSLITSFTQIPPDLFVIPFQQLTVCLLLAMCSVLHLQTPVFRALLRALYQCKNGTAKAFLLLAPPAPITPQKNCWTP
jgi:poly(beta-D-mannuronate) lyase